MLLLGPALPDWEEEFPNARRHTGLPEKGEHPLIIADTRQFRSRTELKALMLGVRSRLPPDGFFLLLSHNRWSLQSMAHGIGLGTRRDSGAGRSDGPWCGPGWTARALSDAGFRSVERYLCFRSLTDPSDVASPDSPFLELPPHSHPVVRMSERTGLFSALHPHHVFICGSRSWQDGGLVRGVRLLVREKVSKGSVKVGEASVRITRFDLRKRGATTLFVSSEGEAGAFIGRLVSPGSRGDTVARNEAFLRNLHRSSELVDWCKQRIPRLVACVKGADGTRVFVETLLPGTVAWKTRWDRVGRTVQRECLEFLKRFNDSLARVVTIDDEFADLLFGADVSLVRESVSVSEPTRRILLELFQKLSRELEGRSLPLVYAHGDFGIGNVLVEPRTGALGGVIDWDTGREWELPGIDQLNWEIQRIRMEQGVGFDAGVRMLGDRLMGPSMDGAILLDPLTRGQQDELHECLLMACGLRYVCRALRYPEIYRDEAEDLASGLQYLRSLAMRLDP